MTLRKPQTTQYAHNSSNQQQIREPPKDSRFALTIYGTIPDYDDLIFRSHVFRNPSFVFIYPSPICPNPNKYYDDLIKLLTIPQLEFTYPLNPTLAFELGSYFAVLLCAFCMMHLIRAFIFIALRVLFAIFD